MNKVKNTTESDIKASVSSIYSALLAKRQHEKEIREEKHREEIERRQHEKEEKYTKDDGSKMSKKERREAELDSWKEIIIGLTGDDLEYSDKKKKKKKYRKWIDDETPVNGVNTAKQKKHKKKNFNKEFEPELNMLRNLVAEQNKFTADLQRRFLNAAGPANKDAMPPNKTMVELASAIMSGRSNSLGMLREIGSVKKTIADLYMKYKKLEADLGSGSNINVDSGDLALLGSSIAASMIGNNGYDNSYSSMNSQVNTPVYQQQSQQTDLNNSQYISDNNNSTAPIIQAESFDPNSWEGPTLANRQVEFEAIPHSYIVEKNKETGSMRFVAIRNDNGEELDGCPLPASDPNKLYVNEKDMFVKGNFDETYPLRYV